MLRKAIRDLKGKAIVARDGEVGAIKDIYFDDERWGVRYFVVDTGNWLPGRKVLISPTALAGPPRADDDALHVELRRAQVESAPEPDEDPPVSRLMEQAHASHYGYRAYWTGPYLWGQLPQPYGALPAGQIPASDRTPGGSEQPEQLAAQRARESHLRSAAEVAGYHINASDGEIGHVDDILIDDETWAVADLIVDTRNWLPGKKVLVPRTAIEDIDWDTRRVNVRISRAELKQAPESA